MCCDVPDGKDRGWRAARPGPAGPSPFTALPTCRDTPGQEVLTCLPSWPSLGAPKYTGLGWTHRPLLPASMDKRLLACPVNQPTSLGHEHGGATRRRAQLCTGGLSAGHLARSHAPDCLQCSFTGSHGSPEPCSQPATTRCPPQARYIGRLPNARVRRGRGGGQTLWEQGYAGQPQAVCRHAILGTERW